MYGGLPIQSDLYSSQKGSRGNHRQKIKAQNIVVVVVMPKTVLWPISSSCLNAGVIFTTPPSTLPVVKVNNIHAMILGVYMQVHLSSISAFIYLPHIVFMLPYARNTIDDATLAIGL